MIQDLARALLLPLKRYGNVVRRLDDNFLPFEFRLAASSANVTVLRLPLPFRSTNLWYRRILYPFI